MMKHKRLSICILCLCTVFWADAQSDKVTDIVLGKPLVTQSGMDFQIQYTISLGERVQECVVKLYLSVDGGEHFYSQALETNVSGDIGRILSSGVKTIKYTMDRGDAEKLAGRPLVFKVSVVDKQLNHLLKQNNSGENLQRSWDYLFAVNYQFQSQADFPSRFGAMIGVVKRAGFYLKGVSDFRFPLVSYGKAPYSGDIWLANHSVAVYSCGVTCRLSDYLIVCCGAGYWNSAQWGKKASDRTWVRVSDFSKHGAIAEAGIMFNYKLLLFTVGMGWMLPDNRFTFDVGIGLCI